MRLGRKPPGQRLWHVDFDKARRCPRRYYDEDQDACHGGRIPLPANGLPFWREFRCTACGLRVANRPFLPVYPGTWYVFHGNMTGWNGWKARLRWFWITDPWRDLHWWLSVTAPRRVRKVIRSIEDLREYRRSVR